MIQNNAGIEPRTVGHEKWGRHDVTLTTTQIILYRLTACKLRVRLSYLLLYLTAQ